MKSPFFSRHLMAAAILAGMLGLSACGNDSSDNDVYQPYTNYLNQIPFKNNDGPFKVSNAQSIDVMRYKMPDVTGKTVEATAMVMTPKTPQPKDGWRVVVWAHGTVGVGDSCAPSKNDFTNDRFSAMADELLKAGYMIVAPDYEGLGTAGIHPYLNLSSASKSAIYAVKAVNERYKNNVQGDWMSVGQSQGGHAVLGIAEYAANDPHYKGTVAGAPASSLGVIITQVAPVALKQLVDAGQQAVAVEAYAELLAYAAYAAVGIKAYEPSFNYKNLFSQRAANVAVNAEGTTGDNGVCLTEMHDEFADDIRAYLRDNPTQNLLNYPGLDNDKFSKDATVQEFLKETQPATKKLNTPTLIIQGQADMAVPYQITQALQQNLKNKGSDVTFELVQGASHTQAIVNKRPELVAFIKKYMPAQ